VDKILHGAADVRFDQPYDEIRIPNVVFVEKVYALFAEIRERRTASQREPPTLYYLSTS
jgi:thioester reductase-like protein